MKTDTLDTPRATAATARHTPGPWFIYQPDEGRVRVGRSISGTSADYVCTLFDQSQDGRIKQANARLIAAAPDLLDTLRTIRHHCQSGPVPGRLSREEMVQIVGAAIDRATEGSR